MAVRIRSIRKCVDDNGVKILVHGPAGSGKTVLGATFGSSTLIISSEKGLLSVRDAPSYVKAAEVSSLDELQEVYDYLLDSAEAPDFDNVSLDSISDIAETVLAYEKKTNKDPRAAYGNLADHVLKLLRDFRDLPHYNVLMTCKQERIDDNGVKMFMPLMPGAKLAQQIPYLFDEVFALRVEKNEDGSLYRVLQTQRDSKYEAKDRSGVLDVFEKPNLKRIIKKIKSGMEEAGSAVIQEVDEEPVVEVENDDKIATESMYGYHAESESYFTVAAGEKIPDNDDYSWLTEEDYTQRLAAQTKENAEIAAAAEVKEEVKPKVTKLKATKTETAKEE